MKKLFIIAIIVFLVPSCITLDKILPSHCDDLKSPSYLCQFAQEKDMRLETVGTILAIANDVAISKNKYTKEQAVSVLKQLKSFIEGNVSYIAFFDKFDSITAKYPGLFMLAGISVESLKMPKIMYIADRDILLYWINQQISILNR